VFEIAIAPTNQATTLNKTTHIAQMNVSQARRAFLNQKESPAAIAMAKMANELWEILRQ